jgi:CheY-like chemotaxis protein
MQRLHLNEVMGEMDRLLRRVIGSDVELVTVLDPGLGPIDADRGQLEQLILNLALNARDAMPDGGKLVIETAAVELSARSVVGGPRSLEPGRYAVLCVTDHGVGMDAETLARAFEPFFTTKGVGRGSGLGLASAWGIAERAGGTILIDSVPERGTTITVYLPEAATPAPAIEPVTRDDSLTGSERVLLVEDDELVRALAARILTAHGYDVLEARYASAALELWGEQPAIDLLLTDVVMPGISGVELACRLVEERPGLAVVVMSGYTGDAVLDDSRLHHATFLQKPFVQETLLRAAREAIGRVHQPSPAANDSERAPAPAPASAQATPRAASGSGSP